MKGLLVLMTLAGGCARVASWQRETLAAPAMQSPPQRLLDRAQRHMFEVREGQKGGAGPTGGGCGCG